jgi:hypothetical protein
MAPLYAAGTATPADPRRTGVLARPATRPEAIRLSRVPAGTEERAAA